MQFCQTRSHAIALFNTTCELHWEGGLHEEWRGFLLQSTSISQGFRAPNMDVRILQFPKRENPPTKTSNRACIAGKPVAHISSTHVASIPKKVSKVSTRKLVAVTLITEFLRLLHSTYRKRLIDSLRITQTWHYIPHMRQMHCRTWTICAKHGAFSITRKAFGLRPSDQSCHPETWIHLDFVNWSNTLSMQSAWAAHFLERTTRGMLTRESQKTYQWNH